MSYNAVLVSDKPLAWAQSACLVILSSLLIGLLGQIVIPLSFTPVPIATRGAVILLLSCFLGPRKAFAAVLGFLLQGALGLPVFSGAASGFSALIGPTGGYLIGYLAASLLVGSIAEKMSDRSPSRVFWMLAAGTGMFFLFGVPYLAFFVGFKQAVLLGMLPFLLGDLLKIFICMKVLQWTRWTQKSA